MFFVGKKEQKKDSFSRGTQRVNRAAILYDIIKYFVNFIFWSWFVWRAFR